MMLPLEILCLLSYSLTYVAGFDLCHQNNPCLNGGSCFTMDMGGDVDIHCNCDDRYFRGDRCEEGKCFDYNQCQNNQPCKTNPSDGSVTCKCDAQYYKGDLCEIDRCVENNPCKNGGTCQTGSDANGQNTGVMCYCDHPYW